MKIDFTQNECELIVAALAAAITNYENSEQKDDVLDVIMNGMTNLIGKIHVKMVSSNVERPSFEGTVTVDNIDDFLKFLDEKLGDCDE